MMHTHYLRCIEADAAALVDLLVGLGALVQTTDEAGQITVLAPRGTWDPIGLIYKRTGGTEEEPVHEPVADGLGRQFWHANLATEVDVVAAIDQADRGRWFIVQGGQIVAPVTPLRIMAGWVPPAPPPPPPSPTKPYIDAVDAYLDAGARAHGYDGIVSACSYAGAPNFFQAESISFLEWRSACWVHCHQVLAQVQANARPVPTPADLVAELPALVLPT